MENTELETLSYELEEEEGQETSTEEFCSPIITQILKAEELLENIDDYFNDLPNLQSEVDEELSDLYHYIENNDLTPKQCTKMVKLIQEKRLVRRNLCNDYEIKKTYNTHRNKLALENQRQFFLTEIHKTAKKLNQQYRYRRFGINMEDTQERKKLAEEEIKNLLK